MLRSGQSGRHLDAIEPVANSIDELFDDLEIDVGLEQCQPHLAQAGIHVFWAEHAAPGDLLERSRQAVAQSFEHLTLELRQATLQARELALERSHLAAPSSGLGEQAQAALKFLEGVGRAFHDVVHGRPRGALMTGDLRQRPIAAQGEVEDLLLVLGEKRSISLEKGEVTAPRRQGVKGHTLTAYQPYNRGVMQPLLVEAFRYNKWANLHLLDVCAEFTGEQLQMSAPGTYGTIASTFLHLLAAEQRYLKRLGAGEPQINERDEPFPGIAVLREHAVRSGDMLIEIAPYVSPDEAHETDRDRGRVKLYSGVVVVQALHHGNDHRTHICTILGHNGLTYGDMDVWAYGDATGGIVHVEAT